MGGELQKRLWVSVGEYHLLDRVGAGMHIFIREGGRTLVTDANVCCVCTIFKYDDFVVSVEKYV